MKPKRIQRKRTKGWKMPENTVYVGRPSKWGNPYVEGLNDFGGMYMTLSKDEAIEEYKKSILLDRPKDLSELKGKDLACWCKEDEPCHADILLELANK